MRSAIVQALGIRVVTPYLGASNGSVGGRSGAGVFWATNIVASNQTLDMGMVPLEEA